MRELLKRVFEKVGREMSDIEQDEFARWLIESIESDERRWVLAFAESSEKLAQLAKQALDNFQSDRCEPLDPEKL